ncbi:hypothetical protein Lal_00013733 [Lupinus albus]|nr:hypothetical protein Lal_00013733 [Lupinus albus]
MRSAESANGGHYFRLGRVHPNLCAGGGIDVYVLVADKAVAVGNLCEIYDQASGMEPVSAKGGFLLLLPLAFSVLLLPPWKARGLVLNSFDTNFVSVSEHPDVENTAFEHSVSVHSKYSDSVHSVAFPNFDHSVHYENMAQPPTPPGPPRQDKLETKIDSLTTLITQLAINQQTSSMARVCGICTSSDHYSDMCPSLLEPRTGDHPEAYLQTYTTTDLHISSNIMIHPHQAHKILRHQMINNLTPTEPSLEELVRHMTMQNMQFQQETRASIQRQESSIQNLTTQMGQMATSLNTLQSQNSDKLPSQTLLNPRNVSAITLR